MKRSDIPDLLVCKAYAEMRRQIDERRNTGEEFDYADDLLIRWTGAPAKVVEAAMKRADDRGLVDYGMWLRGGWLTDKGIALLKEHTP